VTSPLRVSNFRWFFIGEVVNTAGSSMAGIALAFVTLAIHDSAGSLGLVIAAWTVPMVGFILIGGALADRLPRALVLRSGNIVQGLVQSAVAMVVRPSP
jgi:MFS family permease